MKILYLLKKEPDETVRRIMAVHETGHEVTMADLRSTRDWNRLLSQIVASDRVISW